MDRKSAERLMVEMRKLEEVFNSITDITLTMPDEQARPLRKVIGDTIFQAHWAVTGSIFEVYPDLDPERGSSSSSKASAGSRNGDRATTPGGAHG